ncbi:MAG: hypothetical protein K2N48_14810 [Muribaculaceae bacterium]|nr:hypothetical protein [Muribaculaceae bacterium]
MKLYRFIKGYLQNRKYQKILNKVYEEDEIIAKLSFALGSQFRRDWIGRLYTVINPAIKDGKYDYTQVYEYAQEGYDTTEHAQQWIVERLSAIQTVIQTNNLFDVLSFTIKKLDDEGNYLFVVYPVTLPEVLETWKGAAIQAGLIVGAGTTLGIFWQQLLTLF